MYQKKKRFFLFSLQLLICQWTLFKLPVDAQPSNIFFEYLIFYVSFYCYGIILGMT